MIDLFEDSGAGYAWFSEDKKYELVYHCGKTWILMDENKVQLGSDESLDNLQTTLGLEFNLVVPEKSVNQIADELLGTCKFLITALEENEMEHRNDDIEWLRELDDIVFCCEVCNWWYPISEVAEEGTSQGVCFECVEETDN